MIKLKSLKMLNAGSWEELPLYPIESGCKVCNVLQSVRRGIGNRY